MKICIFGGDGFCGWPTALYLSSQGHEIYIVDNLSRRKIDIDLGCDSLTPIDTIENRLQAWRDVEGKEILFKHLDTAKEYQELVNFLEDFKPDAVVHFAEQRSAPFSMKNPKAKRYTVDNNINSTHNILCAIVELKLNTHVVHLGTMGVYGYGTAGMQIPEGYLDVWIETNSKEGLETAKKENILYPADPGSIYHMTKTQDALLFQYYNKNDGIRVTDLHQGVVWGTETDETKKDVRLINRFDYDGDYGTVLNRFMMQAAINHPLTVHGTGGQTRAFIHISDMTKCIEIALNNPPKRNDRVQIFNQMTETHRVRDIANMISKYTGVEVAYIDNPRNEDAENELHVCNDCFIDLGLEPTLLDTSLLDEIKNISEKYKDRCNLEKIICTSKWSR